MQDGDTHWADVGGETIGTRDLLRTADIGDGTESVSVYDFCLSSSDGDNGQDMIQCVSDTLEAGQVLNSKDVNTWLLIYSAALIFFMQAGFGMLCAGSVRLKNVGNTMLKNLLDACGAALGFFSVGYAFAFGGQDDTTGVTFIGTTNFFLHGVENRSFWLFQFAFAATSATIVAGTLAERCQMAAYLCYSIVLTGFVYPVVAHAVWSSNGFLSAFSKDPVLDVGVIDFAGSGVVHLTGGCTALFATMILGPRKGRFYDARGNPLPKPKPFPGHSVALQMLGTFILWFGWYGFNPGSALTLSPTMNTGSIASTAAVTTTLSAAAAAVSALFTNLVIEERMTGEAKFDLLVAMNGSLSGLVAVTGGCAVVEPWAAVLIGMVAGWLYLGCSNTLLKLRLDDAVEAIPVHLANGFWGLLSIGLFASPQRMMSAYGRDTHVGLFYSLGRESFDANLLAAQILGILFIVGWVLVLMLPFFIWLSYMGWFRADSLEELVGLDISYHGGGALLDGQQGVKTEYLEALQRKRQESKRRVPGGSLPEEPPSPFGHPPDVINASPDIERYTDESGGSRQHHEAPQGLDH